MTAIRFALFTLSLFASGIVLASDSYVPLEQRLSPEQLRETGLDTLNATQLAKLNAILGGQQQVAPAAPAALAAQQAVVPASSPPPVVPSPPADKPLLGFNDKPIISRLKGTITGWDEGTVFELENGQQWKVLKGKLKLPKPMLNPEVKLVPGIVGRWFLQVSEDYPMARVYLIN